MTGQGGLGLDAFLGYTQRRGSKWADYWKDRGHLILWLPVKSLIYPVWLHRFMFRDVVEDKKTGKEIEILRWPRPTCLEPEEVSRKRKFRRPDGAREVPPQACPFCRLEEWLRRQDQVPLEQVVFEWQNPKDGSVIKWNRGELSGLVDTTQATFSHSLAPKQEFIFTMVDHEKIPEGIQLVRETLAIGIGMSKCIAKERDAKPGDMGDPFKNPYAFKWVYDANAKAINDKFAVYRYDRAELTPEVRALVYSTDLPDPSPYARPQAGEAMRMYAAMEAHARIKLPMSELFEGVDLSDESTEFPGPGSRSAGPDVTTQTKPADHTTPAPGTGRRRKKAPDPETIPCDDCHKPMDPRASKCPHCGAEYEVSGDPVPATVATQAPQPKPQAPEPKVDDKGRVRCWACESVAVEAGVCQKCGVDQADNIPY